MCHQAIHSSVFTMIDQKIYVYAFWWFEEKYIQHGVNTIFRMILSIFFELRKFFDFHFASFRNHERYSRFDSTKMAFRKTSTQQCNRIAHTHEHIVVMEYGGFNQFYKPVIVPQFGLFIPLNSVRNWHFFLDSFTKITQMTDVCIFHRVFCCSPSSCNFGIEVSCFHLQWEPQPKPNWPVRLSTVPHTIWGDVAPRQRPIHSRRMSVILNTDSFGFTHGCQLRFVQVVGQLIMITSLR